MKGIEKICHLWDFKKRQKSLTTAQDGYAQHSSVTLKMTIAGLSASEVSGWQTFGWHYYNASA